MKRETLAFLLFAFVLLVGIAAASRGLAPGRANRPSTRTHTLVPDAGVGSSPTASDSATGAEAGQRGRSQEVVKPQAVRADGRRVVESEDDARLVEGRVVLPSGAAPDPSLSVVALGDFVPEVDDAQQSGFFSDGDRTWDKREVLARAPVGADGSFQLQLPPSALSGPNPDSVLIDIDGLVLFLPEPVAFDDAGAADADALVLEPELGAAIRGTLQLPEGSQELPSSLFLGAHGMNYAGASMSRAVLPDETLEFELRALQPGLRFTLWAQTDIHPTAVLEAERPVEAGEVRETDVQLERGATVHGRIVDASGAPIANAEIHGDSGATFSQSLGAGTACTDQEGRFEMRGLLARNQTLFAQAENFLDGQSDALELTEGLVLDDLTIVLEKGLELGGTVRWPGGEPAVDARLTLAPLDPSGNVWRVIEAARSPEGSGRSGEDGSFRLRGLAPGAYALYVDLVHESADDASPVLWNERVDSVEAGTLDLELTLNPPAVYSARVLDDRGAPVDAFTVRAQRSDWPGWGEGPAHEVKADVQNANGRFELAGLDPGAWSVSILSETHLPVYERLVTVHAPAANLESGPTEDAEPFVLTRTARIAGIVLSPDGEPVSGAEIRASTESVDSRGDSAQSDAEGRFLLESVGPGPIALEALANEWAPSVKQRVELQPGDDLTEHTLHLTEGGAVTGKVYDKNGAPDASRTIVVQSDFGNSQEAQSDADGRFTIEHLAPGPYQVIATPDPEAWMWADSDDTDLGEFFNEVRMTSVTVVEGETVEVSLGAPPRAPVVVHGRVLRSGEPVAQAGLLAVAESGNFLEGLRADTTGDDGGFELELDEPGDYTFVLGDAHGIESEVDFQVTIPEVDRYALDLVLPTGSISGRVIGAEGGGSLWIRREDRTTDISALMGRGYVSLEEDGSFLVETLHAGRYALSARSGDAGLITLHDVLVVEDECTSGVELQLGGAGRILGVVKDERGVGVDEASVFLRDAAGRALYELEGLTNYTGSFAIDNVPAGELFLSARSDTLVSASATPVSVATGTDTTVELTLTRGVMLQLTLEDEENRPMRAALRVENEDGHDFAGIASQEELQRLAGQDVSSNERRIGPLPAGRYTVRAHATDGRSAKKVVSLRTGEGGVDEEPKVRRVVLRLRD